ncbi:MAG: TIGR01212 family radical SAM protein, partial [Lachnospiraceae bacterium]|nr:TIGR01212 family radical SAM protein [Lachnospiraceae bacterium]
RGCIFCSAGGAGEFAADRALPISEQLAAARALGASKNRSGRYIAYFQAFTNTYAPAEVLRARYFEAAAEPDIAAVAIATRPDCLQPEVLSVLAELAAFKPVTVELGLQTAREESARFIRRGYPLSVYDDAVRHLSEIGVDIVTHLILGLPGETREDMLASVRHICSLPLSGVKLQLLHILQGTDLASVYESHPERFPLLELPDYIDTLLDCLAVIPEHIVIHRLTGDGPKRLLIAPKWSANKKLVLNTITQVMNQRDFYQGEAL